MPIVGFSQFPVALTASDGFHFFAFRVAFAPL
jgi:hypothetical protein